MFYSVTLYLKRYWLWSFKGIFLYSLQKNFQILIFICFIHLNVLIICPEAFSVWNEFTDICNCNGSTKQMLISPSWNNPMQIMSNSFYSVIQIYRVLPFFKVFKYFLHSIGKLKNGMKRRGNVLWISLEKMWIISARVPMARTQWHGMSSCKNTKNHGLGAHLGTKEKELTSK